MSKNLLISLLAIFTIFINSVALNGADKKNGYQNEQLECSVTQSFSLGGEIDPSGGSVNASYSKEIRYWYPCGIGDNPGCTIIDCTGKSTNVGSYAK